MLLSPMFRISFPGVDVSPFERLVWFGLGHLEREQRLNQHALLDWCRGPDPFTWWPRAMQATALLFLATCTREFQGASGSFGTCAGASDGSLRASSERVRPNGDVGLAQLTLPAV